ncbi:hypothetical protein DL96DRAFT_1578087 [Flagelloscypha sp. PMI_526]|nr:hypothetical protein DL96DRAFT_1578087 [Flagelloscypha sp. PMI_526]
MHLRQSSRDEDPGSPRGHRRIHSRNLSVHFPRPAAIQSTITEDDADETHNEVQEIEIKPKPFGSGTFKFGAKPPSALSDAPSPPRLADDESSTGASSKSKRRGHHHKHSMSHNFFSFLEPGSSTPTTQLHSQPTPTPLSPWTPMSGFTPKTSTFAAKQDLALPTVSQSSSWSAVVTTVAQGCLGSILWVRGQQAPSLATTALGYWVVFDAFGLAICSGIALRLMGSSGPSTEQSIRRPFGKARLESLLLFAQVVYLMFAAVYVCKETVEHLLLSTGGAPTPGDGHHHRPRDEEVEHGSPIEFPLFLIFVSLFSLLWTGVGFENHAQLVSVTNTRIPLSFAKIIATVVPAARPSYLQHTDTQLSDKWVAALTNPYTALPMLITISLLGSAVILPPASQHTVDLFMAAGIALLTGDLAYRACVVLGAVLLQTSPPRSKPSKSSGSTSLASVPTVGDGKMEKFLRVMREVERHPHVLHLPAPHIWQVSPLPADGTSKLAQSSELVVTMDLHVRPDLSDDDALNLSRWVWERCIQALGVPGALDHARQGAEDVGAQVTVGIVRG